MSRKYFNANKIPEPEFVKYPFNKDVYDIATDLGVNHIAAKILAQRDINQKGLGNIDIMDLVYPDLKKMPNILDIKDIGVAADRIADAVVNKEHIGLACDFDVDGISSAAVMVKALNDYFGVPAFFIHVFISHRMKVGYGFTENVADRVLDNYNQPTLVVTADQGSSNGPTIDYIKNKVRDSNGKYKDVDVIISDHHHIDTFPKSAYAFVNPQRHDDIYPDKTICGCTVAMCLMSVVRLKLIEKGYLQKDSPKLTKLLSYSTAATVADCVSMASPVNRAIVVNGINEMNMETYPAWREVKKLSSQNEEELEDVDVDSLGFGLGPRINACSRTGGDGILALKFYLSENENEAIRYLDLLSDVNEERKKIEKKLIKDAFFDSIEYVDKGYNSLVIFLPEGHHGIHGIVASRIVERFGRPVVCVSPKEFESEYISLESAASKIGWKNHEKELSKIKNEKTFRINNIETIVITKSKNKVFKVFEVLLDKNGKVKSREEKKIPHIKGLKNSHFSIKKDDSLKVKTSDVKEIFKSGKHSVDINKTKRIEIFHDIEIKALSKKIRTVSASARSIEGLNIYKCLKNISDEKSLFLGWGGHEMAAGLSFDVKNLDEFRNSLEEQVSKEDIKFGPKIYYDGEIKDPEKKINEEFYDNVAFLEPYGNGFPKPKFLVSGYVESFKLTNETAVFKINIKGKVFTGISFKWEFNPMAKKIAIGDTCDFIVTLRKNNFKGKTYINFIIDAVKKK